MEDKPSTAIRLNPFKGLDGPDGRQVPWSPYGRILDERPAFTLDPRLHAGCYYVQDSSAMFVGYVFRRELDGLPCNGRALRVLDLCAAPGGKTTDLAASLRERAGDDFELVSNEVMKQRAGILADNVAVWGDPNVQVISLDPAVIGRKFEGCFDIIVADVPCSGEGMFRKDAEAREQWSPELVDVCAARQKRILADVWPALKAGGVLIYSTCTYEEKENDCNLEWAASELGGDIVPPEDVFTEYGVARTRTGNLLRAGVVPGEGQWCGALHKFPGAAVMPAVPAGTAVHTPKGEMKAGKFIPDCNWALSLDYDGRFPSVEMDLRTALQFLHRDSIRLDGAPRGFVTVSYHGHPLGFVNNLGTRCNNLLPQSRRIRMDIPADIRD